MTVIPAPTKGLADGSRRSRSVTFGLGVQGFLDPTMMGAVGNECSRFDGALASSSPGLSHRYELAPR